MLEIEQIPCSCEYKPFAAIISFVGNDIFDCCIFSADKFGSIYSSCPFGLSTRCSSMSAKENDKRLVIDSSKLILQRGSHRV